MAQEGPNIAASSAFSALAILRNTEVQMRWEGAKLGALFNIPGLIGAALQLSAISSRGGLALLGLGCILGAFANQYLYMSIRRAGKHFRFWCAKMKELEEACPIEKGVQIFTSAGYASLQRHRMKTQELLLGITKVCIVMWAIVGVMTLGAALLGGKS